MRARNIKPSFFKNEDLGELAPLARLLFAGLWCLADRDGRLEDRPKRIKAEVLPYDDCDADTLLDGLAAAGFIARYEAGSERYIAVVNFGKHQNPHMREPASTIPAPDQHCASTMPAPCDDVLSPAESPIPHPDSGFPLPESPTSHDGSARERAYSRLIQFGVSPRVATETLDDVPPYLANTMHIEAAGFADYWRDRPHKDLDRCWRNWVRKVLTPQPSPNGSGPPRVYPEDRPFPTF